MREGDCASLGHLVSVLTSPIRLIAGQRRHEAGAPTDDRARKPRHGLKVRVTGARFVLRV